MPEYLESFFKKLIYLSLIPILLLGFFVALARSEWANHPVISAVQITEGEGKTNHDFIEIYNPTLSDINLKGYRLVKHTKTGASDTSIKSWTDDAVIKAHGWRLWASSDDESYSAGIGADDATKQTIAADNGIAIRFGAADTGEIIDAMAWGAAENIFKENLAPANPGSNEKLIRKPGGTDTGNGEDTNSNADDFILASSFIPRNSGSSPAPAISNTQSPGPTPGPSPSADPGTGANSDSLSAAKKFPVAYAGEDKEAVIGETIDFDGSDSYDPLGKRLTYNWDFGDGPSAKGENVSYAYKLAGSYDVVLKISNSENTSEDFLTVKIIEPEFSDKIILSEILPNPVGADKDGEWIELFNSGDKRVNLRGWILRSGAKISGKQYQFSGNNFIETKSFLTVRRDESGLVLTNGSGSVSLVWPPDKILSTISYGAAKEGESYALVSGAWQWTDKLTPGKENIGESIKKAEEKTNKSKLASAIASQENNAKVDGSNGPESTSSTKAAVLGETIEANGGEESASEEENISLDRGAVKADNENISQDLAQGEKDKNSPKENFPGTNDQIVGFYGGENNPWFWGDMMLSALSLFLVWRYQEIRKKIK